MGSLAWRRLLGWLQDRYAQDDDTIVIVSYRGPRQVIVPRRAPPWVTRWLQGWRG